MAHKHPLPKILYGDITVNGKTKTGSFRLMYNRYSDRTEYLYHTPKGYKGTGGFTVARAMYLLENNRLSTEPPKDPTADVDGSQFSPDDDGMF